MPDTDALPPPLSPAVARATLQDVIARMSDTDVVALCRLICQMVLETPTPHPRAPPRPAPPPGTPDDR